MSLGEPWAAGVTTSPVTLVCACGDSGMNGSWCLPRKTSQFREGKVGNLLAPGRDSSPLLRLAEGSRVCGRLVT